MKVLLLMGGFRIGDTFHLLPLIDSLKADDVTWVTGTYERPAVELIQKYHPQVKEVIYKDDNIPTDFNSRRRFAEIVYKQCKTIRKDYDKIIDNPELSSEWGDPNAKEYKIKEGSYFPIEEIEDYICTHSHSISAWKDRNLKKRVKYPLPIKSLDELTSMEEAFHLLNKCRFLVGIHSAMACLAVYCNKPVICCGTEEADIKFSSFRKFNMDFNDPTTEDLQKAVDEMLKNTAKPV